MAAHARHRITDVWSAREKLSLASSVKRSGDNNWVSVSRAIRQFGEPNRPNDWFSQRNCAIQYADLLEKVETPKRKRGEREVTETPGDVIVRKLTIERIEQLKRVVQEEQLRYKQLKDEVRTVMAGQCDDQLDSILQQILAENKRLEEVIRKQVEAMEAREHAIKLKKLKLKIVCPGDSEQSPVTELVADPISLEDESNQSGPSAASTPQPSGAGAGGLLPRATPPSSPTRGGPPPQADVDEVLIAASVDLAVPEIKQEQADLILASDIKTEPVEEEVVTVKEEIGPSHEVASEVEVKVTKEEEPTPDGKTLNQSAKDHDSVDIVSTPDGNQNSGATAQAAIQKQQSPTPANSKQLTPAGSANSKQLSPTRSTNSNQLSPTRSTNSKQLSPTRSANSKQLSPGKPAVGGSQASPSKSASSKQTSPARSASSKQTSPARSASSKQTSPARSAGSRQTSPARSANSRQSSPARPANSRQASPARSSNSRQSSPARPANSKPTSSCKAASSKHLSKASDASEEVGDEADHVTSSGRVRSSSRESRREVKDAEDIKPGDDLTGVATPDSILVAKEEEVPPSPASSIMSNETDGGGGGVPTGGKGVRRSRGGGKTRGGRRSRRMTRTKLVEEPQKDWESGSKAESSDDEGTQPESDDTASNATGRLNLSAADSIPNSPASVTHGELTEDEKMFKVWKKSIMLVWRAAANHKYANVFLHPVTEEIAPGYHSVVRRPKDLTGVKKNIETGVIRTTAEFQRDMMLMFTNAIMYNSSDHDVYHMAQEMYDDVMLHIEQYVTTQMMVAGEPKLLRTSRRSEVYSDKEDDVKRKRVSSEQEGGKAKKRKT